MLGLIIFDCFNFLQFIYLTYLVPRLLCGPVKNRARKRRPQQAADLLDITKGKGTQVRTLQFAPIITRGANKQRILVVMTKKGIKQTVQDEIALEKVDIQAARTEFYREFSMHGGDGPWNNYGENEPQEKYVLHSVASTSHSHF